MKKTYQIKINQGKDSKVLDVTPAGTKGQAVTIKAEAGARYQLVDTETSYGPENIRASRQGKDLKISFEGSNTTDLVIEDYYKVSPEGYNGLIGETESGKFYEYIPESASGMASVPMLAESGPVVGMALGGAEVAPAGAAVGVLAAGLFSPWLVGAGALGAAAAAGGGGGGAAVTVPVVKTAYLLAADDSGPKDNVTNIKSPRITGEATANSDISITVGGKTYTGKADANGIFSISTEGLADGVYTAEVTASSNGVKSAVKSAEPFTVDTSQSHNYLPEKTPDPNSELMVSITSISEDTGLIVIDAAAPRPTQSDFLTKDSTLVFNGSLSGFTKGNGDWVELVLKDSSGKVVASDYVQPTSNGTWSWSWDKTGQSLADGKYKLQASVIDGAGNQLKSTTQDVVVDTSGTKNGDDFDLNSTLSMQINIADDTGFDAADYVTRGIKSNGNVVVKFKGVLDNNFSGNGDVVLVQVIDKSGFLVDQNYVDVVAKSWSYENLGKNYSDGIYVVKATVYDLVGNIVDVSQQSLIVDNSLIPFSDINGLGYKGWGVGGIGSGTGKITVNSVNFYQLESGFLSYSFKGKSVSRVFYKAGEGFDLTALEGKTADKNDLIFQFEDVAGNVVEWANTGEAYDFTSANINLKSAGHVVAASSDKYPLIGEVGTHAVSEADFDMATLYKNIQTLSSKDPIAVNKVDMLAGDHVLHITMGDVLAFGVKDSFVLDGKIQVLVDGDTKDVLNLDNLVGSTSYDWITNNPTVTSGGNTYQAYTHNALGIEVLVQKDVVVHLV